MTSIFARMVVLIGVVAPSWVRGGEPVSFRERVAPILVRSCLGCHDAKKPQAGLDMSTFARLKKGGKAEGRAILEPGDAEASGLVAWIGPEASPRMPYKAKPLTDEQIRTIERWVEEGAKFDGGSEEDTPIASLVDPLKGLPKVAVTAKGREPVSALVFGPRGRWVAAAVGRDVRLIDTAEGKVLATLGDHPGPIAGLAVDEPGGRLVVIGGRAGMFGAVRLWDLATKRMVGEAKGHADAILGARLAPDGKTLATVGYDRDVILWTLDPLAPSRTLKGHTDAVYAVEFAPDGKTLATAGADRTVKLWDVATGKRGRTLSDANAEVYALAYSPDGTFLYAGGVDRNIRAYRVTGPEVALAATAIAHDGPVLRMVVTEGGKGLVSSGEDRAVKGWGLPGLTPRWSLPGQSDWPQAIAPDAGGTRLAVGRYDGSVELVDAASGKAVRGLVVAEVKAKAGGTLFRNASLNPITPRGGTRGSTVRVTLTGNGVGGASEVVPGAGITAKIIPATKPDPNRIEVDLVIAAEARPGVRRIAVLTPLGMTGEQPFAVDAYAARAEVEPNDEARALKAVALPATLMGAIEKPGDVDHFRFEARAGRALTFVLTAKEAGSPLVATMSLVDPSGRVVDQASSRDRVGAVILGSKPVVDGLYSLRVEDEIYGGSPGHAYRIDAGEGLLLGAAFPLGVPTGGSAVVRFEGVDAGAAVGTPGVTIEAGDRKAGAIFAAGESAATATAGALDHPRVVVADGPQGVEGEPNDEPGRANRIGVPGGMSGRIHRDGDVDLYKFAARKGERVVLEVFADRLGTPVDATIEVLDLGGKVVPRAILKPVSATEVAFRDHASGVPGIRLTKWDNLEVNDTVLIGREVAKVFALPRNPDDDCLFWAEGGRRVGFLETTPEHHPMGQAVIKVEVYPPDARLPAGGATPITLDARNDDGGPGFLRDARVTFDPPADGEYLVRVGDARGLGGADHGYHVVARRPRPDFQMSVSQENPAVPRGGTALVAVNLMRLDGFEEAVMVEVEGLPEGMSATGVTIAKGANTGWIALSAGHEAPTYSAPGWKLVGRSASGVRHELDPGGEHSGRVVATEGSNVTIEGDRELVEIAQGGEVSLRLTVGRSPAFAGRVPIELKNLPQGVLVENIGLNGVLVPEKETTRTITLRAAPWAELGERPFYAVGKAEAAGTEHASHPFVLRVVRARGGSQ